MQQQGQGLGNQGHSYMQLMCFGHYPAGSWSAPLTGCWATLVLSSKGSCLWDRRLELREAQGILSAVPENRPLAPADQSQSTPLFVQGLRWPPRST